MTISIHKCGIQDLDELREIGIRTFSDTFAAQNKPENLHAYLTTAFDKQRLEQELKHPESAFFFIYCQEELAGFLKINTGGAQSERMGEESLEIERLYVRTSFKRMGLGGRLMQHAFETAKAQGKRRVWLGVWEKNEPAILFYERQGFVLADKHTFQMGDEEQIDWIMVRTLA